MSFEHCGTPVSFTFLRPRKCPESLPQSGKAPPPACATDMPTNHFTWNMSHGSLSQVYLTILNLLKKGLGEAREMAQLIKLLHEYRNSDLPHLSLPAQLQVCHSHTGFVRMLASELWSPKHLQPVCYPPSNLPVLTSLLLCSVLIAAVRPEHGAYHTLSKHSALRLTAPAQGMIFFEN